MAKKQLQIDSGILQFTPKGAYYESADEQAKQIFEMWKQLVDLLKVGNGGGDLIKYLDIPVYLSVVL
jgi:hypothetical protein